MCSGSVIHAVHTNEMPEMGGLRKKMPYTAYTMLIGCLAIAVRWGTVLDWHEWLLLQRCDPGTSILFPDKSNPGWGSFFFLTAAGGAAITAFYMFRLWYMTFAGTPRDARALQPRTRIAQVDVRPLIVTAVMAIGVAWKPFGHGIVSNEALLGAFLDSVDIGCLLLPLFGQRKGRTAITQHDDHGHDATTVITMK